MTGRSRAVDPRVQAARRDLADVRLAERVFAPHYAAALPFGVATATPIREAARPDATAISETLVGERFDALELSSDWAWGICRADGTVGYVAAAALGPMVAPTHIVRVPSATLFNAAGMEQLGSLPMGSRIAASGDGALVETSAGFIASADLQSLDTPADDPLAVAEALIGVPAKPGGRSGAGLDGAGLLFLSLSLAGITAPRFCDLQRELGSPLADAAELRRGDLLFFDDHAAIMADGEHLIHLSADGGPVARERLDAVLEAGAFGPIIARRRLA